VAGTLLAIAAPVKHCQWPKSHLWRLRKTPPAFSKAPWPARAWEPPPSSEAQEPEPVSKEPH